MKKKKTKEEKMELKKKTKISVFYKKERQKERK